MKLKRITQWIIAPIILLILVIHGMSLLRFIRHEYTQTATGNVFFKINHVGVRILDSLDQWQTLTTGILALCAAFIGVLAVVHQTNEANKLSNRNNRQKADALRLAHLPFLLSSLTQFCKDEAMKLDEIYSELLEQNSSMKKVRDLIKRPEVEKFLHPYMIDLLETHEGNFKRNLVIFCKRLQLYQARLSDLKGEHMIICRQNLLQLAVDLSEIKARIDKFFPLARFNGTHSIEEILCDVSAEDVQIAALSIFWTSPIDNLRAAIDSRAQLGEMDISWPET